MYCDETVVKKHELKRIPEIITSTDSQSTTYCVGGKNSFDAMNLFIKDIIIDHKEDMYYIRRTTGMEVYEEMYLCEIIRIMQDERVKVKLTKQGFIAIFTPDRLIITLDFNKYNVVDASELRELGHFYGSIFDIDGDDLIIKRKNGSKFKVPFVIKMNFLQRNLPYWLEIV